MLVCFWIDNCYFVGKSVFSATELQNDFIRAINGVWGLNVEEKDKMVLAVGGGGTATNGPTTPVVHGWILADDASIRRDFEDLKQQLWGAFWRQFANIDIKN